MPSIYHAGRTSGRDAVPQDYDRDMEVRERGRSGVGVPRVVLGCGNFGGVGSSPAFCGQGIAKDVAFQIMDTAWGLGVRAFDTADADGGGRSESWIGDWLASKDGAVRD